MLSRRRRWWRGWPRRCGAGARTRRRTPPRRRPSAQRLAPPKVMFLHLSPSRCSRLWYKPSSLTRCCLSLPAHIPQLLCARDHLTMYYWPAPILKAQIATRTVGYMLRPHGPHLRCKLAATAWAGRHERHLSTKGEVVKLAPTTFDRCGRWFESQCRHTLSVLGGFG